MKKGYLFFILFCVVCMALPFACMPFAMTTETTENKELRELPQVAGEDGVNINYLGELGAYFNEHFAFRQQMVSANAMISGKLLKTSSTDEVLIGKNDWLYYTGTLDDYTSQHLMSERGLFNAVHNLRLMQDYAEANGSRFLLTIAPNKNSLYDENMPCYYTGSETPNNYERLEPMLRDAGIRYVDLFEAFRAQDEVLYFRQDSHWTNKGALLAYNTIMRNTSMRYDNYADAPYETVKEHTGDLAGMLYPLNSRPEENEIYQTEQHWCYVNEVQDNMDNWIQTSCEEGECRLLLLRDSFAESLVPFFAEEFETAFFSRIVPYNLENIPALQIDYTVIERVERRISGFAESAAIMEPPVTETVAGEAVDSETTLQITADEKHYVISGILDGAYADADCRIYLTLTADGEEPITYEPFYISREADGQMDDYGFEAYFPKELFDSGRRLKIEVAAETGGSVYTVAQQQITN